MHNYWKIIFFTLLLTSAYALRLLFGLWAEPIQPVIDELQTYLIGLPLFLWPNPLALSLLLNLFLLACIRHANESKNILSVLANFVIIPFGKTSTTFTLREKSRA
jgi:hypothetical protein